MADTVVKPRTVMVHLQHTSDNWHQYWTQTPINITQIPYRLQTEQWWVRAGFGAIHFLQKETTSDSVVSFDKMAIGYYFDDIRHLTPNLRRMSRRYRQWFIIVVNDINQKPMTDENPHKSDRLVSRQPIRQTDDVSDHNKDHQKNQNWDHEYLSSDGKSVNHTLNQSITYCSQSFREVIDEPKHWFQ